MWDYICPRCRREVAKNSHKCPYCGEPHGVPLRVPSKVLKDKEALEKYVHEKVFPKVSSWQREYLTQFFTEIFSDGFETGNFNAWTDIYVSSGCTLVVETFNPHHGNYNLKGVVSGTAAGEFAFAIKNIGTSYTTAYARGYVKYTGISGLDASEIIPCIGFWVNIGDTNTARAGYGKNAAGTVCWAMRYFNGGSFYNAFGSSTPEPDKWYCVELRCSVGASATLQLFVNGNLEIEVTDVNNSARQFSYVHFGIDFNNGVVAATVYGDCVVVADTYIGTEPAKRLLVGVGL